MKVYLVTDYDEIADHIGTKAEALKYARYMRTETSMPIEVQVLDIGTPTKDMIIRYLNTTGYVLSRETIAIIQPVEKEDEHDAEEKEAREAGRQGDRVYREAIEREHARQAARKAEAKAEREGSHAA